jgi:hypothetical protein
MKYTSSLGRVRVKQAREKKRNLYEEWGHFFLHVDFGQEEGI